MDSKIMVFFQEPTLTDFTEFDANEPTLARFGVIQAKEGAVSSTPYQGMGAPAPCFTASKPWEGQPGAFGSLDTRDPFAVAAGIDGKDSFPDSCWLVVVWDANEGVGANRKFFSPSPVIGKASTFLPKKRRTFLSVWRGSRLVTPYGPPPRSLKFGSFRRGAAVEEGKGIVYPETSIAE